MKPLVWSSVDSTTWSLVDSPSWRQAWSGLVIGPMPAGWDELQHPIPTGLVDVASGPAGLVAIGNSYGDDGLVPVVLHSTDGREWSAVSLPADSVSPLLSAVVPYDGGFVLVGAVDAGPRVDSATPAGVVLQRRRELEQRDGEGRSAPLPERHRRHRRDGRRDGRLRRARRLVGRCAG